MVLLRQSLDLRNSRVVRGHCGDELIQRRIRPRLIFVDEDAVPVATDLVGVAGARHGTIPVGGLLGTVQSVADPALDAVLDPRVAEAFAAGHSRAHLHCHTRCARLRCRIHDQDACGCAIVEASLGGECSYRRHGSGWSARSG